VGNAEVGQARLPRPKKFSWAANGQVQLRQLKTVLRADHRVQPFLPHLRHPFAGHQDAIAFGRAATHAPRSWCSCASPKRSACSTTMTEALGTSTPTSITVVAT